MSQVHLVTGATGFVGGAVVLELLRQSDSIIVCGVRGPEQVGLERLRAHLERAASLYDCRDLIPEISKRCRTFSMDLADAEQAMVPANIGQVDTVWHSAASLNYEEKYRDKIFCDNRDGTRNVLSLARKVKASRFNYVSTAYVAGQQVGHISEEPTPVGVVSSNCYEESKIAAEALVAADGAMECRILRPSIVVGHSRTSAATSFTGLYGFVKELLLFKEKVSQTLGNFLSHRALAVKADPDAGINLIPVDLVAKDAVRVGLATTEQRVFHLTADDALPIGDAIRMVFSELQLRSPRFVSNRESFTSLDSALDEGFEFYSSYLRQPKTFERGNTNGVSGTGPGHTGITIDRFGDYVRWYLDYYANEMRARKTAEAVPVEAA